MRIWFNGRTRASQACDAGSIPVIRLHENRGLWHRIGDIDLYFYVRELTKRSEFKNKSANSLASSFYSCDVLPWF